MKHSRHTSASSAAHQCAAAYSLGNTGSGSIFRNGVITVVEKEGPAKKCDS